METPELTHITPAHRDALSFHPSWPDRDGLHDRLRQGALVLADLYDEVMAEVPSCESSLAQTALQESLMWANAAVAIHYAPDPAADDGTDPEVVDDGEN